MNRAPSQPKPHSNLKPKYRSPLKDLNAGVVFKSRCSTCTSSSTETTAGCSRFPLSSSSNSSSNASNHRLSDCNSRNQGNAKPRLKSCKPFDQGRKIGSGSTDSVADRAPKVIRLRRCQTIVQKKVISSVRNALLSRCRRVEGAAGKSVNDFEFTPLGCKNGSLEFGFGDALGSISNCDKNDNGSGNTPPAKAAVSPEIQCGTTVMPVATPVCCGAGHVLSGASDKRKCRPRGVLVVVGNCNGIDGLNILNEDSDGIGDVDSGCALVPPLPGEASVHWLLSPYDEDVEQNGDSELLTSVHLQLSLSGSSGFGTSSNISKDKNAESSRKSLVSSSKSLLFPCFLESPSGNMASTPSDSPTCTTPNDEGVVPWFYEKIYSNLAIQNSPCSKDSLGSENLMKTPESYSSLERHISLPLHRADNGVLVVDSNLDYEVEGLRETSFSSEHQILVSEQFDSSFEFDCLLKPASSTEFSQVRYNWDKSSWISDAIVKNDQHTHFRISWRDGLSSHLTEMDKPQKDKCLPDEEDKNDHFPSNSASPETKFPEIDAASFGIKNDVKSAGCLDINENSVLQQNIQYAESISLDGGSLASSGDSGWNVCYKNNLFKVE